MCLRMLVMAFVLIMPLSALANPVSFKDGYGVMPTFTPDWSDVELNYSFTNRDSAGVSYFHRSGKDSTADFGLFQYNRLLQRWNELDSQANLYLSIGAGGRSDSEAGGDPAGYAAFQADYETRRIYTLAAVETLQSPQGVDFNRLKGRIGISPFLAPIDSLQLWLVTQIDYMPEMERDTEVTPIVRLFYHNYALEAGVSLRGTPFVAAMAHF